MLKPDALGNFGNELLLIVPCFKLLGNGEVFVLGRIWVGWFVEFGRDEWVVLVPVSVNGLDFIGRNLCGDWWFFYFHRWNSNSGFFIRSGVSCLIFLHFYVFLNIFIFLFRFIAIWGLILALLLKKDISLHQVEPLDNSTVKSEELLVRWNELLDEPWRLFLELFWEVIAQDFDANISE